MIIDDEEIEVHHMMSNRVPWVPIVSGMAELVIEENAMYLFTDGERFRGLHGGNAYGRDRIRYELSFGKFTHVAIVKTPESAIELPSKIFKWNVVTVAEQKEKERFDQPIGTVISDEENDMVIEAAMEFCKGCIFNKTEKATVYRSECRGHHCRPWERTDRKRVIYRSVTTAERKQQQRGGEK